MTIKIANYFILLFLIAIFGCVANVRETKLSESCFLCESAVEALCYLYEQNSTEEIMLRVAVHICEHYANNDTLICSGLVSQFQDSFLYVFEKLVLRPSQLCGLILPDCGQFVNPFDSNWTILLPPKDGSSNQKAIIKDKHISEPIFPPDKFEFKVLQLSDLHYDPLYAPDSEADCSEPICCQRSKTSSNNSSGRLAGYWGTVGKCDLPYRTIVNMLQHISEIQKIDYIILTGDLMSHSVWTYTKRDHSDVIRLINATLNKYLPGVPIFWAVGNHEGVPINSMVTWLRFDSGDLNNSGAGFRAIYLNFGCITQPRRQNTGNFGDIFAPHFAPKRFRPDWLYQEIASAARRWIPSPQIPFALYFLYINQTDPDKTLSWLIDELYECELLGCEAHIIAHIPPGDAECLEGWARNYYRIVNRFSSTIKAQFFGHVHTDSFTLFYENMNNRNTMPVSVLYSAPSVTTFDYLNPAYRIYTVDAVSNTVTDFDTYFLNISAIEDLPRWELLYSAKKEYDLKDLSAASWNELAKRIYSNETVFQLFLRNYVRRDDYECDANCRAELLCSLWRGHHAKDELCVSSNRRYESVKRILGTEPPRHPGAFYGRGDPAQRVFTLALKRVLRARSNRLRSKENFA